MAFALVVLSTDCRNVMLVGLVISVLNYGYSFVGYVNPYSLSNLYCAFIIVILCVENGRNMFKKPFRVKTNTQLKGSDIKKLKLRLLKSFPSIGEEPLSNFMPNKETVYSVKIIVHSGEIVHLYCIQKLPVIFEVNDEVYPTVYMLWSFPDLLPVFTTFPQVFSAISGGADLMLPGVVLPGEVSIKSYGKLNKGDHVTINLTNNKAPIAVGKAALSSFDMYMSAKRGKCVNILHFLGDTLSNYGSTLPIPEMGAVTFDLKPDESHSVVDLENASQEVTELHLNVGNDVSACELPLEQDAIIDHEKVDDEKIEMNKIDENSEDDVNDLLMYCFLKSIKTTLKKSTLPLLASTFYKQHVLANCPKEKPLDIKKTKYKKFTNFLNEMADLGIIKLELLSKGVQSISSVSFDNILFKNFDEKYIAFEKLNTNTSEINSQLSNKPITPEIKEKHTVTAAVLPLFSIYLNKKGDSLPMDSIKKYITDYVKVNNLRDEVNKKNVKPDKLLRDIVGADKELLTWEVLINSIVNKMGHSYELSTSERKPTLVKGKLQPIDIQIGSRVGNKKVTLVSNLELYGINTNEFAQECQHGVGASTTINNIPNSKSAQVQIQGNQVIFVNKLLTEKYNIQKRFIQGLENAPKRKK